MTTVKKTSSETPEITEELVWKIINTLLKNNELVRESSYVSTPGYRQTRTRFVEAIKEKRGDRIKPG